MININYRQQWTCDDGDHAPNLEKEEREKQNGLKAKVYLIGPFYFTTQDT